MRWINRHTFVRAVCLSCFVQLPQTVALDGAFTHKHIHFTRNGEANAIHLPETLRPAPSKNHFLLILPCPPFHIKTVVSLHHPQPPNKKVLGGWGEDMFTGVVPLASTPTTMTILMMMMTKMMTQKNALLQSIWPVFHDKKVTFGFFRMMMRAVYVLLSVNHNFPPICRASVNLQHTEGYCMRNLYYVLWCFWCCSLITMIAHYYSLLEHQPETPSFAVNYKTITK